MIKVTQANLPSTLKYVHQGFSAISQQHIQTLQSIRVQPRKSKNIKVLCGTLYMVGCNDRNNGMYSWNGNMNYKSILEVFQSHATYLETILEHLWSPRELSSHSCNKEDHIHPIKFKIMRKLGIGINYALGVHLDGRDKSVSVLMILYVGKEHPTTERISVFYMSQIGGFVTMEHGDIIIFNGKLLHGSSAVQVSPECYRVTLVLF